MIEKTGLPQGRQELTAENASPTDQGGSETSTLLKCPRPFSTSPNNNVPYKYTL